MYLNVNGFLFYNNANADLLYKFTTVNADIKYS